MNDSISDCIKILSENEMVVFLNKHFENAKVKNSKNDGDQSWGEWFINWVAVKEDELNDSNVDIKEPDGDWSEWLFNWAIGKVEGLDVSEEEKANISSYLDDQIKERANKRWKTLRMVKYFGASSNQNKETTIRNSTSARRLGRKTNCDVNDKHEADIKTGHSDDSDSWETISSDSDSEDRRKTNCENREFFKIEGKNKENESADDDSNNIGRIGKNVSDSSDTDSDYIYYKDNKRMEGIPRESESYDSDQEDSSTSDSDDSDRH